MHSICGCDAGTSGAVRPSTDPLPSCCCFAYVRVLSYRREERSCRFCFQTLPDWREHLIPEDLNKQEIANLPYMAVVYNGTVHKIRVRPGPEGQAEFKAAVRSLFGLAADCDFDVTFECK